MRALMITGTKNTEKGPKKEPGKSAAIPINKLQMDEMKCGMVREKRGGEIVKGAMV